MNWTQGMGWGVSISPFQGPLLRLGELVGRNGYCLAQILRSVSPKDGPLGAELTDTVIAWYRRKH